MTSPSAPVMTSAHLIVIHVSVLADSISKHARLNAGKKGLPIYAPQYCNNTCNLLAPAPSVHHSCVLTELFEVKLQGDFASFPYAFIGLNEARLPRLLQGLPHAFEKHATGCGSMLRTNCCVRTLVHQDCCFDAMLGANKNATQFQNRNLSLV